MTDRKIEATFAALLDGASPDSLKEGAVEDGGKLGKEGEKKGHKKKASKSMKGDHRPIIECQMVEEIVFQREKDPEKVYGRRKNRKARFVVEKDEDWKSVDMVDRPAGTSNAGATTTTQQHPTNFTSDEDTVSDSEDEEPEREGGVVIEPTRDPQDPLPDSIEYGYGSGKIRPPQDQNDVNGSVGGEKGWAERIEETEDMKEKRREGQRRAEEREMVRKAARRGCAFGFVVEGDGGEEKWEKREGKSKAGKDGKKDAAAKVEEGKEERRKCEAVMKGVVVESSFAKGDWGIRWREMV